MRTAHEFHGLFDMAPLARFLDLALALAGLGSLRGLGDRLKTMLLQHLPRDRVNLRFWHHVALPLFGTARNPKLAARECLGTGTLGQPRGSPTRCLTRTQEKRGATEAVAPRLPRLKLRNALRRF